MHAVANGTIKEKAKKKKIHLMRRHIFMLLEYKSYAHIHIYGQ